MISTLALFVALNSPIPFEQLEQSWWDCDTKFQRGDMEEGDEWEACKKIGKEFDTYFKGHRALFQYWLAYRKEQWAKRGFTPDIGQ